MFLHVTRCEHVRDYVLRIAFDSGEEIEVDLGDELDGEIFEPLKDVGYFQKFDVSEETGTVEWPNGADFAPEFLREKGKVLQGAGSLLRKGENLTERGSA